jgi:ComF family protein
MAKNIIKNLLDIIFPCFCLNCQKEGTYLCRRCFQKIQINNQSNCYVCGKLTKESQTCSACLSKTHINRMFIAGKWEDQLLRQIIYEYKYRFIKEIHKELAETLINYINIYNKTLINNNIVLSFVPLHKRKLYWRGFNQSELLAKELSDKLKIPLLNLIARSRPTPPQVKITDAKKRHKNVSGAFSLLNPKITKTLSPGKIIILVDDICTTGATLEECAKALKILKPKEIWGLVLVRG